jgi:hypothetical protein
MTVPTFRPCQATQDALNHVVALAAVQDRDMQRQGLPALGEQDLTPEAFAAKAQYWVTHALQDNSADAWAMVAFVAASACGRAMVVEAADPVSGDDAEVLPFTRGHLEAEFQRADWDPEAA